MPAPPEGPIRQMLRNMSPTWLSREWGEKMVIGLMGYTGDALIESSANALKAPWLLEDTSPQDAVDLQASETGIRRYAADTDATHRARAQSPWGAWEFAGTQDGIGGPGEGIDGQLHLLGYPNSFTLADYEFAMGGGPYWSRFWVFIADADQNWTDDGIWSDPGTWDDGGIWDISATAEEIRSIRQLIRQWKAGHEICEWIVVLRGGELWDYPAGVWSDPGNWDDGGAPIFLRAV